MVTSLENFSKCCRCCLLTQGPMEPLFRSCLDDMLAQLTNLPVIQNDGYPQQMCSRCILKLSSAHTFYLTVKRSLKTVEEVLKTAAVENKNEEMFINREEIDEDKESFTDTKEANIYPQHTEKLSKSVAVENATEPDTSSQICSKELRSGSEELTDTEEYYQCPQCKHNSENQEDLKVHLQTHLAGAPDKHGDLEELAQLCNYCGKRFRWRTSLCKHLRQHRGNLFQCKYCDKRFAEATTLKVHLVSHSIVNPKPFQCAVCKKHFGQKSSLKKHEQAHAADRTTHCCAYCEKSFFLKQSLKKHCAREHAAVVCSQCGQQFTGERALATHTKTHRANYNLVTTRLVNITGKMPTEESSVSNAVSDPVSVQTVTVEFLCLLCSNKFQSKERLEVHLCLGENVS